jgi:hypothetical protein
MKIISFNFNKVSIEKLSDKIENLKINTNIDISKIDNVKSDFLNLKEDLLGVNFKYLINYDPNFAKIELIGTILLAMDSEAVKEVLEQWKEKKMSEDFKISLFNVILKKSNIKAIQLEDEMNLPIHIQLPSLKKPEEKKE